MSIADQKILAWLMKGAVEYNKVTRDIDFKVLNEALLPEYRSTFQSIESYYSRYKTPPSFKILEESLAEDIEMVQLSRAIESVECKESEILFYVDQVRKRYNSELARRLAKTITGREVDVDEFNSNITNISAKLERLKRTSVFAEGNFSNSADERYNDYLFTEQNPNIATGVMSGFREIDDYTYGIKPSELMIISGASSSGKSLLMMNYAINAWLGQNKPGESFSILEGGKNVVYFTLEMSKRQLEQRIDANMANIPHRAIMRGQLTPEQKIRWKNSLEFQKEYDKKFYIVDMPRGSRALDIEARYDAILSEFQPDLVVVDYLGIMKPNRDFGQDWLEVGHVAEDLHEFCRNKNIAVLTAAQRKARNKATKGQSNDLEELGRSKMIGDNANIVLLIEQRDDEHLLDDMVIHIVKNRDGAKGEVKLYKEFEKSKITSIPDNWTGGMGEENSFV